MSTSEAASGPFNSFPKLLIEASPASSASFWKATSALASIWDQHLGLHSSKPGRGNCNFLPKQGNQRPGLPQAQRSPHNMATTGSVPEGSARSQQPVALLSCGSFNPPTVMHLRMFDLARFALEEVTPFPPHEPERQDALACDLHACCPSRLPLPWPRSSKARPCMLTMKMPAHLLLFLHLMPKRIDIGFFLAGCKRRAVQIPCGCSLYGAAST